MTTKEIIEGFAVETTEGLIFTVKGLVHPPDRVIAYLRYLPDSEGERVKGGKRYRRVYHFKDQQQALETQYPAYLAYDPVFGIEVQGPLRQHIRTVYDPCHYLGTLRQRGATDRLEEQALNLARLLDEEAGDTRALESLESKNLGITGSLLIETHCQDSDLDLVVYGEGASRAVYRTLGELLDDPGSPVRRPDEGELAALHAAHAVDTPLSLADFCRMQNRKVNEGHFQDQQYFIRFVKRPAEVGEKYGDFCYQPVGSATIRARVIDDRDAIFTPCRYVIEDTVILNGPPVERVREIISFRGRFSDQARAGEWITAHGSVERVVSRSGSSYYRLVVGGTGDYLYA